MGLKVVDMETWIPPKSVTGSDGKQSFLVGEQLLSLLRCQLLADAFKRLFYNFLDLGMMQKVVETV